MDQYFFDYEQLKLINLLVYTNTNPKPSYKNSELKKTLNISSTLLSSIYYKLENLNNLYSDFEFKKKHNGCIIRYEPSFSINKIYNSFFKSSLNYILLDDIYNNSFINFTIFSEKVHFSTRTIQRSSVKLKLFLDAYNISLKFTKRSPLVGDEVSIRYFYEKLNWELFDEKEFNQNILSNAKNKNLLDKLQDIFPTKSKYDLFRILNIIKYSFIRYKNSFFIESLPEELEKLINPDFDFSSFSSTIMKPYFEGYDTNSNIFKLEVRYVYAIISLTISNDKHFLISKENNLKTNYINIADYFVKMVEEAIETEVSSFDQNYLKENFIIILVKFNLFRTNQFSYPVLVSHSKESKFYLDNVAEIALKKCSDKYQQWENLLLNKLFINKISTLLKSISKNYVPPIHISLQSKNGENEIKFWFEEIKYLNFGKIQLVSESSSSDLIISDFPVDESIYFDNSPKILTWSPLLRERNIINIKNMITQIQNDKLKLMQQKILEK